MFGVLMPEVCLDCGAAFIGRVVRAFNTLLFW